MGAGSFIAGLGATVGIILIIVGALISLTGIGALIGIPLIIIGIAAIIGGAAGGATVGVAKATYKVSKELAGGKSSGRYCIDCCARIHGTAKYCPDCGKRQ